MEREILFRGKRVDNGEWVQGSLIYDEISDTAAIVTYVNLSGNTGQVIDLSEINCYTVIPEMIGQYTGLTDKNGKRIFEGDIIDYENLDGIYTYMVAYDNEYARFAVADDWFGETKIISDFVFYSSSKCIVTGNIHDNPEFLK